MTNKKWLAALAVNGTNRIRRVQAVCYMSLLLNGVLIFSMLAMMIFGR
ncbi:hypothetical protein IGI42_003025 [Enterococcus sp. AZ109]